MTGDARRIPSAIGLLVIRWSGLVLAVVLAMAGAWVPAAVAMLVALEQVIAWRIRLPLGWEVATSLAALIAATSSYLDLYARLRWWDIPVHAVLTGLLAVLAAWMLRRTSVFSIVSSGVVLSVVWEALELGGHVLVDSSVYIQPTDTIGDIAAGIAGSAAAAAWFARGHGGGRHDRSSRPPQ